MSETLMKAVYRVAVRQANPSLMVMAGAGRLDATGAAKFIVRTGQKRDISPRRTIGMETTSVLEGLRGRSGFRWPINIDRRWQEHSLWGEILILLIGMTCLLLASPPLHPSLKQGDSKRRMV